MKRWAVLVVLLYAMMLALLTMPVAFVAGLEYVSGAKGWRSSFALEELLAFFQHWGWWLWLAVMAAGQALLLLVPVSVAERRPVPRRKLLVPVLTASFFLGNVVLAGVIALLCAVLPKDVGTEIIFWPAEASARAISLIPAGKQLVTKVNPMVDSEWGALLLGLAYMALFWMIWGLIFFRYSRDDDAQSVTRRATRWLLRGSILEVLVAVPCHIVVRQRGDCCAPAATFWGITTGLTVMLLAFGPGVFFLFVERVRRLRPKS